jgi:hypothetical protein
MAKKKFLEDVKLNPSRFYRLPSDVNRDRRLNDEERLEILDAWERDARASSLAAEETMTAVEPSQLEQVIQARLEAQKRVPGGSSYPPNTSKYGNGVTGAES